MLAAVRSVTGARSWPGGLDAPNPHPGLPSALTGAPVCGAERAPWVAPGAAGEAEQLGGSRREAWENLLGAPVGRVATPRLENPVRWRCSQSPAIACDKGVHHRGQEKGQAV